MGSNNNISNITTSSTSNTGLNSSTSNVAEENVDTSSTRERASNLRESVVNSRYSVQGNYGSSNVYSRVDQALAGSNSNSTASSTATSTGTTTSTSTGSTTNTGSTTSTSAGSTTNTGSTTSTSTGSTTNTGSTANTSHEAVATSKKNRALEMLGDLILESAVSTNSSNIAVHKDQQLSGVVKSLSEIFGDQESRTGYTGISGQVLNKFKDHQKFNNGAPIALSTETLAEIYKFVAVTTNTETSTTPIVLKGIDNETKKEIKDVDDLIKNQISKYESMLKTNSSYLIKEKLSFWTREKNMQEHIKSRLDKVGVDEDLQATFKKSYSRKVDMLENKAQEGPFAKNNSSFYGNLMLVNSTLAQMATGASREDIRANRELTTNLSQKVTEKHEKLEESREIYTELRAQLKNKNLSKTEIKNINTKLKNTRKQLDIQRSEYFKFFSLNVRFGLRSAFNFNDTDRAQYTGAIKDIEALDGEVDLNLLP